MVLHLRKDFDDIILNLFKLNDILLSYCYLHNLKKMIEIPWITIGTIIKSIFDIKGLWYHYHNNI